MNHGITRQEQIDDIDNILQDDLVDFGVICALVIDTAGNIISSCEKNGGNFDIPALAALAAGNFAAIEAMAHLVGEKGFSFQYHKGENIHIHFSKVNTDLLLVTIFDRQLSLGLLRLKVADAILQVQHICQPDVDDCMLSISPGPEF